MNGLGSSIYEGECSHTDSGQSVAKMYVSRTEGI
jgi:hypothetical protein